MRARFLGFVVAVAFAAWMAGTIACSAATITVGISPSVVNVGDTAMLTIAVQNGTIGKVDLPQIEGIQIIAGSSMTTYAFTSGTLITTRTYTYHLVASQPGDYAIPAFDVGLGDGTTLRSLALILHVKAARTSTVTSSAPPARAGPVVMPPASPAAQTATDVSTPTPPPIPRDADGGPAKVFMLVTPQSTSAYVGEMVPLRIDFYIRQEANADQDSLPTLKGSDFMMNDFTVRGHASIAIIENQPYECDTFLSAFTAPKNGDFPLAAERDTYWVKSVSQGGLDPFGFTKGTDLGHVTITSNQYIMHIHPLPEAGRPDHFSGAVGQFEAAGDAQPDVVTMGQPVTITFGIRGIGNFDYVHCPVMAPDPHWNVYAPKTTVNLSDEMGTQGSKTFELSAIPQQNGNVSLPRTTFSFFDPKLGQYVTVPIDLPTIAVTGAMPLPATSTAGAESAGVSSPPTGVDDFAPNRPELGDLVTSMLPIYRAPWFWPVQGVLLALPILGLMVFSVRRWARTGRASAESAARRRTLRQEENTMADAARRGDARAFFLAARHAVQLQLGAQWGVEPESITLGEIRRRDSALAESVSALFAQADEVLYSGRANANLDLAHWQRVTRECLQLQTAG